MTISAYIREAAANEWPDRPRPKGYRLVVVDALRADGSRWRLLTKPDRPCRWTTGPGHQQCRRPAVVELLRGASPGPWGYCERHLYGRKWNDGRIEQAVLVDENEVP